MWSIHIFSFNLSLRDSSSSFFLLLLLFIIFIILDCKKTIPIINLFIYVPFFFFLSFLLYDDFLPLYHLLSFFLKLNKIIFFSLSLKWFVSLLVSTHLMTSIRNLIWLECKLVVVIRYITVSYLTKYVRCVIYEKNFEIFLSLITFTQTLKFKYQTFWRDHRFLDVRCHNLCKLLIFLIIFEYE